MVPVALMTRSTSLLYSVALILQLHAFWRLHYRGGHMSTRPMSSRSKRDDMDAEEQRLALEQSERDRQIANRAPAMPASLYEKAKVLAQLVTPVVLCDLDDVSIRTQLSRMAAVAAAMSASGVPQLDRSVITAQGPHLEITRAISGFLMRETFEGHQFSGIRTISRWKGEMFALFQGWYQIGPPLVGPIPLNRNDPDVIEAATMTGLVP
jgi:hypothetical protein